MQVNLSLHICQNRPPHSHHPIQPFHPFSLLALTCTWKRSDLSKDLLHLVTGWVFSQISTKQLSGRQYDCWCWPCSRRWRQNFPFWHQHRTWITLGCVFTTAFREYLTNINLLPPSTGTATGDEGWKHHKRNKDISFFPKLICPSCGCRTQYIHLSIPLLFTFYVARVISKNVTKSVYADKTVLKKPSDRDGGRKVEDY